MTGNIELWLWGQLSKAFTKHTDMSKSGLVGDCQCQYLTYLVYSVAVLLALVGKVAILPIL